MQALLSTLVLLLISTSLYAIPQDDGDHTMATAYLCTKDTGDLFGGAITKADVMVGLGGGRYLIALKKDDANIMAYNVRKGVFVGSTDKQKFYLNFDQAAQNFQGLVKVDGYLKNSIYRDAPMRLYLNMHQKSGGVKQAEFSCEFAEAN